MAKWYLTRDGQEFGPLSPDQLRALAAKGRLRPETPLRREDMKEPKPAGAIKGLSFTAEQPAPSPAFDPGRMEMPPPAPKARSKRPLLVLGGLAVGCVLMAMLGTLAAVASRSGPAPFTGQLTADFYPYEPGLRRQTSGRRFMHRREMEEQFGNEYTHDGDGVITCRNIDCFAPKFMRNLPLSSPKTLLYRHEGDYIEVGTVMSDDGKDVVWDRLIKVGAKPGDTWERDDGFGNKDTYTLLRFEEQDFALLKKRGVVPREKATVAVIEQRTRSQGYPDLISERHLAHGIGLIRDERWQEQGGERVHIYSESLVPTRTSDFGKHPDA